ncbi:MAG: SulP family inorganic anion transporter, partial [Candidatus Competibacteraceae bacterium]|nr:SulP family inorganic anion transporter [Candidatus Competibacteraceae bacterium]
MKTTRRRALGRLLPFLDWIRRLNGPTIRHDLLAGLTGAVVVLPQGVAFALIAGLPAEYGLYTAVVTPVVAALFGSSRHLVSGPTTAISVVVLGVAGSLAPPGQGDYVAVVLTLTFLVGVFQLALGLARLGVLVNFISHTVVIGFTGGAAVLIIVSQLQHFFTIDLPSGQHLLQTLGQFVWELEHINYHSALVATATLVVALLVRHYRPRWPYMLVAILAGSAFCWLIDGVEQGVPMVGALPGHLPPPSLPAFSLGLWRDLAPGTLAVAILGLIEAVSIARAIATRSHQRIDGNQEFIGQGLSNLVGSCFSCYPGSGSFTRSGINFDAGARTPLSALFASLLVAVFLVFLAPLTAYLPMPAMAGVIMLVAWNLVDLRHIRVILRASNREATVMAVTFLSTLLLALEFAIYAGVLLSLVLYLRRTSQPRILALAPDVAAPKRTLSEVMKRRLPECPQLKIIRLDGSIFFGAVDHVQGSLHRLSAESGQWKHVLVLGGSINFIDVAGAEMLTHEAQRLRARGGGLYLCNLKDGVRELLRRGGY